MASFKKLFRLFLDFLKIGCFTFGGGLSIVAQINDEFAVRRKEIASEELLDLTSVARSLPGIMICNTSMLFGYRMAGFLGGLVCVVGLCIPPMVILTIITTCYTVFQTNPWVMAAMSGIRAAIVPIIISAAITLTKGAYRYPPCYFVTALALVLAVFFSVSSVWLVLMGVAAGLIICEIYERKGEKDGLH